jgi:hypothetical protein
MRGGAPGGGQAADLRTPSSVSRLPAARRPRALIAVRLSPERLADDNVTEWLAILVGPSRQTFVVGTDAWVAVIDGRDDEAAMTDVRQVRMRIKERFGDDTGVASRLVGEGFTLPAASAEGRAAPPVEVMGLLDVLARVGR